MGTRYLRSWYGRVEACAKFPPVAAVGGSRGRAGRRGRGRRVHRRRDELVRVQPTSGSTGATVSACAVTSVATKVIPSVVTIAATGASTR